LSSSYESKLLILCSPKNKPFLLVRAPTTETITRVWKGEKNKTKKKKKGKHKDKRTSVTISIFFLFQMSNITGDEGSFSSGNTGEEVHQEKQQQVQHNLHGTTSAAPGASNSNSSTSQPPQQQPLKKKRNLPGTPGKFNHPTNF
jgi:hypothetical protein